MSFFLVLFGFILLSSTLRGRAKERQAKLDLVDRALARPDLDAETRRMLADAVQTRSPWRFRAPGDGEGAARLSIRHIMLIVGWIGIFIGIGIASMARGKDSEVGVVMLLASIGLITLPFALREFEKRRPA